MRKIFLLSLVILLTISIVGCSGGQETTNTTAQDKKVEKKVKKEAKPKEKVTKKEVSNAVTNLKDGKYLVKYNVSSHGNFPMAYMKVEDGRIASFEYNEYLAQSGEVKKDSNYDYKTPQVVDNLNKQFRAKKDLAKVDFDVMSGATHTKNNFKQAVKDLMAKAKAGKTYTPKYEDGVYKIKAKQASHGWLPQLRLVVKYGTIVGVDYDAIATKDDGKIDKGDEKTVKNYKYDKAPKAMKLFEKQIINKNGVQNINYDVVSGATHTKDRIVKFAGKLLQKSQ
ncbi:major membrane immunogen, membrane-anchored lipoprotein [Halobacteroides halobius DSM 5150]|uniref:Major membrane immunogen, membrane-anchored lipoprotein n=1 Tax=Halobacteroides halobius (strain ATCC 35273 / DSM 5150 / MD-1) TaxID=748449 RepID=L0KCU7_HALHC|nr:FMN-binding protein [Halobacteroides halobius]AGB41898.1 major membrane immunogen, membrane-anchored lipoprotein [Halobacteroides halobius DSM 5150]